MFQIALVLRLVLVTGRIPLPSGMGSANPQIPCLSARLPVAIEFHNMGDRMGRMVASLPLVPSAISLARVGI